MNAPRPDDLELRNLLDSIGIHEQSDVPDDLTAAELDCAERMLADLVSQRTHTKRNHEPIRWTERHARSTRPPLVKIIVAVTVCMLLAIVTTIQPWGGPPDAVAHTPPMLQFSDVRNGEVEGSGDPARDVLQRLASVSAHLPAPDNQPIQHLELAGWWASSTPPDESGAARSTLSPIRSNVYLFPNNDRRSIEQRGHPLDAHGRLTATALDGATRSTISDTVTKLDPEQGATYLQSLPESTSALRQTLAPEAACAETKGGCLLNGISTLFENFVVPPDLTARLWATLATEPSITTLGHTTDRSGQEAVALTAPSMSPTEQMVVLVDPATGRYLGSELILVAPDSNLGFTPPAVIAFTYVVESERISLSQVPDDATAKRY